MRVTISSFQFRHNEIQWYIQLQSPSKYEAFKKFGNILVVFDKVIAAIWDDISFEQINENGISGIGRVLLQRLIRNRSWYYYTLYASGDYIRGDWSQLIIFK